jgi:hypothetical protein
MLSSFFCEEKAESKRKMLFISKGRGSVAANNNSEIVNNWSAVTGFEIDKYLRTLLNIVLYKG